MTLYRIKDWNQHFENNRTRELAYMRWVPIPNAFDGDRISELIERTGADGYGAWCALLLVAGRCGIAPDKTSGSCDGDFPRGTLLRGNGKPHDARSLSIITRLPQDSFEKMLPVALEVGLIEACGKSQEPAEECRTSRREVTIEPTESNEPTEYTPPTPPEGEHAAESEVVEAWNASGFPTCRKLTKSRKSALRQRLRDPDWRENWRAALARARESPFCNGGGAQGWRADLDWFLRPDSVTKLLEGRYDDGKRTRGPGEEFNPEVELEPF